MHQSGAYQAIIHTFDSVAFRDTKGILTCFLCFSEISHARRNMPSRDSVCVPTLMISVSCMPCSTKSNSGARVRCLLILLRCSRAYSFLFPRTFCRLWSPPLHRSNTQIRKNSFPTGRHHPTNFCSNQVDHYHFPTFPNMHGLRQHRRTGQKNAKNTGDKGTKGV